MSRRRRPKGLFITFEGIEGCGKTTQIRRLARTLKTAGLDVVVTHEPGATQLGAALRGLLLSRKAPSVAPSAELLLFAADRAQHIEEVVLPALDCGAVVLCDRYLDATLAYQGFARGLGTKAVLDAHRTPPLDLRPCRTILIDLDPAQGLARARRRAGPDDRMHAEGLAFHRLVRKGYLTIARREPERVRVVAAGGTKDAVERRIHESLRDLIPALRGSKRRYATDEIDA